MGKGGKAKFAEDNTKGAMRLEGIVKDILGQHDYVALPGLGSFCRHYEAAKLDEQLHTLQPPQWHVDFNTTRQFDDGCLAHYLQLRFGYHRGEAEQMVKEWLLDLTLRLNAGTPVTFPGLGTLQRQGEELTFAPLPKKQQATSTFGLTAVPLPPQVTLPIESKSHLGRTILIGAVLGVLILGGILVYPFIDWSYVEQLLPWNRVEQPATTTVEMSPSTPDTMWTDSSAMVETPATADTTGTTQFPVDSALIQAKALQYEASVSGKRYYLVVGVFDVEENAKKRCNQLLNRDYTPNVLQLNGRFYVYVGLYTDLSMANSQMGRLRAREDGVEFWIKAVE